jgi:hypothetical protein
MKGKEGLVGRWLEKEEEHRGEWPNLHYNWPWDGRRGTTKRVLGQTQPRPDEPVLIWDPLVGITGVDCVACSSASMSCS